MTLEGNTATVHSIQVFYVDDGPEAVCVCLNRAYPKTGGLKTMSTMSSRGAEVGVRNRTVTTIKPDTMGPDNTTLLRVTIPSGTYGLLGVTIIYTSDL